jgi:hypothetical protein
MSDLLSLEQVPETGRWRFMDVSPKFEAAVRALPFLAVHTWLPLIYLALGGILRRTLSGVPWKASPTLTCYHTACPPCRLANP